MAANPRVIIVGGGLAGLAAALRLSETGYAVELLEKRPVLGGRASSFLPPGETEPLDNCQHVLLGCFTNLLDFFRRIGADDRLRFYSVFWFCGPQGISSVSSSALPAPLHLLPSLLQFQNLKWPDRWSLVRAFWAMLRAPEPIPDQPLLEWLQQHRQTPRAVEYFWRVILTSALNEELERLSARHAFQVIREAFLRNRLGYRMAVPTVPLSDLYSREILEDRCTLRLATPAASLEVSDGRVSGLRLQGGEAATADFYISTVPPDTLANLLPTEVAGQWQGLQNVRQIEWSPITGIHLWFDHPITHLHHTAVLGRTIQWVFNRTAIDGAAGNSPALQHLQLVVSASRALLPLRRQEILDRVLPEMREIFPGANEATLVKVVVVKEARATLSLQPPAEALRLDAQTPFPNLFLAGDWTATGWPPTMEGAVRSGYRAAELVTAAAGRPRSFLQPDLPSAPLVRLFARL